MTIVDFSLWKQWKGTEGEIPSQWPHKYAWNSRPPPLFIRTRFLPQVSIQWVDIENMYLLICLAERTVNWNNYWKLFPWKYLLVNSKSGAWPVAWETRTAKYYWTKSNESKCLVWFHLLLPGELSRKIAIVVICQNKNQFVAFASSIINSTMFTPETIHFSCSCVAAAARAGGKQQGLFLSSSVCGARQPVNLSHIFLISTHSTVHFLSQPPRNTPQNTHSRMNSLSRAQFITNRHINHFQLFSLRNNPGLPSLKNSCQ